MASLRLPVLGRAPGRGFRLPVALLAVAAILGAATLYGATLTLPVSEAAGPARAVGIVETVARVRVESPPGGFDRWTVGSHLPVRWRTVGVAEWTESTVRVVGDGSEGASRPASWTAEWVGAAPPGGTTVDLEIGDRTPVARSAWRRALDRWLP